MSKQSNKASGIKDMRLRVAAAALLAGFATGCAPDLSIRPQSTNTAQWIQLSHKVAFAPGQATLSPGAARAIDAFVHRAEVAYGDRIVVKGGSAKSVTMSLAAQRAKAVIAHLRRHRIPSVHSPAAAVKLSPDESGIVVGRYIAIAPNCPAWSDVLSGGDNVDDVNRFGLGLGFGAGAGRVKDKPLGCVTESALGAQIADPGDLVDGGRLGPGDGQFFSRGMRRYRADKTKEAKAVRTSGEGK